MPVHPNSASIDYSAIRFPSDRVTIADLRRAHPERFDAGNLRLFDGADVGEGDFLVSSMLYIERLFAAAAYGSAAGDATDAFDKADQVRRECLDDLIECYAKYGIASGRYQTKQLIRDIESQAATQAAVLGK